MREDVVRAGRHGSPWEFTPLALGALRVLPADAEIRFLLGAAYAQLGLRTAATEQLDRLPERVHADPSVLALRQTIHALADDRVGLDELERTVLANVDALLGRSIEPVDLRAHVACWHEHAGAREFFRAGTGDIVGRVPGDAASWESFEGQKDMAAALHPQHDPSPTASIHPPPYFVEGMDPPWLFLRLYGATPPRYDGHASLIVVAQQSQMQFLHGLAQHRMVAELADPRVRVFVGADAGERVERFVRERTALGIRSAGPAIVVPSTRERVTPALDRTIAGVLVQVPDISNALRTRIAELYPARERSWWAHRHAEALSGVQLPLRVLLATSRYTTFVCHSVADLADALRTRGCEVRVHMEPDDHAIHDLPADLRVVAEFRPDLIVAPNYLRAQLGSSYAVDVPFVTWVQDSMTHLFDASAGAAIGESDFVIGNVREEMFQQFGFPRARSLRSPMVASQRKFHAGPVATPDAARHACEIAYVSHHARTPEALHALRRAEDAAVPRAAEFYDALFPRIIQIIDRPISAGPLALLLRLATIEELRRHRLPDTESALVNILNTYTHPIADRALRHRTLEWAAALAARRGWRIHLYGRGWETHPTLAPHARGELAHGEDLRACYQAARVHLHISLHTAVHQRVFECAMSGGLPICRLQADDLSQLEYLAAAHACRAGARPIADVPALPVSRGYHYQPYPIDSCDQSRRYGSFVRSMGLDAPQAVWLNSIHAQRLLSCPTEHIDGEGQSVWDLWPDPAAIMFHDQPSLERVLTRAVEASPWRDEQSAALGTHVRQHASYDALARQMLDLVASGLANTRATATGTRWYDTPGGRPPTPRTAAQPSPSHGR